jgi:hypothetical protein
MNVRPVPKPSKKPKPRPKEAPSILQDRKECYITGAVTNLHKHHIFGGNPNRQHSDEYGCWVWLSADLHNLSKDGVHFNKELDLALKREAQSRFEAIWGREKFIEVFGKSYL